MSLGLSGKLNILQESPHDAQGCGSGRATEPTTDPKGEQQWIPSRYTVRAVSEDGSLVLWNTFRGSMNVFTAQQRPLVEVMLQKSGFKSRRQGMVQYLADRGFLVREGVNEYRQIQFDFGQQQFRTDILQLCLLASEDCNFRCHYCYEKFERGTMQPEVREGVKKLLLSRVHELDHLGIEWFGGEPLYGMSAIEDLAPFFLKVAKENSISYGSSMTTNGYLLTSETVEKLLAWNIRAYQITLDGPKECHDHSRPTRTGEGTFDVIIENLRYMRELDEFFDVDIRVNWDRSNFPKLDPFLDLISRDFGDDERFKIRFHSVFDPGGPNSQNLDLCGMDEAIVLQKKLEKEARLRGLKVGGDLREIKSFGSSVCYAARPYHFVVGATGKVMKCTIELDTHERNIVGQLKEDGELKLDRDKLALWCEPAFESDSKCQKCAVLPVCAGVSCPLIRFNTKKSPCIPLRRNFKSKLLESLEFARTKDEARKVVIGTQELKTNQLEAQTGHH